MNALPWFRTYTEAVDDAKLGLLEPADRWYFIAILCCKGQGLIDQGGPLLHRLVAKKLGVSVDELHRIAQALSEVGLIDVQTLQPHKWDERQYQSDSSTKRVREYRERMKATKQKANAKAGEGETLHETFQQRSSNVTETAQETDTETDTEEKRESEDGLLSSSGDAASTLSRSILCPNQKLVDLYHEKCPDLPRMVKVSAQRANLLRARWRDVMTGKDRAGNPLATTEAEGLERFAMLFERAQESGFLRGSNGRGWTCPGLHWLMTERHFLSLREGAYDNKQQRSAA
jgi:predicted ArsR family transcriptional regulator